MSDSLEASMMKHIGELKAENERLRMEQRLKAVPVEAQLLDRVAELKAEVERLRKGDERDMTTAYLYAAEQSKDTIARLKAQVERLTADLNKMTKTPDGVDYVDVDVGFWTKSGIRLPSSYSTFWSNDKGVQS